MKPKGRKVGKAGLPAWCRGFRKAFGQCESRYQAQADETVSEPPGGKGQVLAIDPGPRRNRRRRERRAIRSRPSAARKGLSETGIETPGVKLSTPVETTRR